MKKPILAAVSKRAEVLEEGVKWRGSDWFSKVQHQSWRGKDYEPLWEVLDVAEEQVGQRLVDHHGAVRAARDPDLVQVHAQHLFY